MNPQLIKSFWATEQFWTGDVNPCFKISVKNSFIMQIFDKHIFPFMGMKIHIWAL